MTRGQHAVLVVAALATAAVSSVSAQSVASTLACVAPPGFARFDIPLERARPEFLPINLLRSLL